MREPPPVHSPTAATRPLTNVVATTYRQRITQVWRIRDRATFAAFRGPEARSKRAGAVRVTYVPAAAVGWDDSDDRIAAAYGVGRHVGGAAVRNQLRRRCRAVVQAAAAEGRLPGGAYLVSLSPEAAASEPAVLRDCVERALAEVTA